MSVFNDVKNYMRSPKCLLLQHSLYPDPNHSAAFQQDLYLNATCCDNCQVEADKVDVYYWPEPNADTSCQSIIGDEVSRADAGATTDDSGNVYWGCTSWLPRDEIVGTDSSTIWTTATLTSVAALQFKAYIYNPWQESPCGNVSISLSSLSNTTTGLSTKPASIHPRGHSLVATNNASTTVLGTYTFTSPSIYVNFQGLNAGDYCGTTSISSTMLAFSAGELSTIIGPVGHRFSSSRAFNPGDLPCPPQSIMSENWYKPLPGVPYRPYFAFPDKVRHVVPWFTACNAFWFNAFDPPRTLRPVANLDPSVTTEDPKVSSQAPIPSITQDPGPTKTPPTSDTATSAFLQPANSQPVSQPKQTAGHGQDPAANGDQSLSTILIPGGDPDTVSVKIDPSIQHPADPTPASQPKQTAAHSNGDPTGNGDPAGNGDTTDSGGSTANNPANNAKPTSTGDPASSAGSTSSSDSTGNTGSTDNGDSASEEGSTNDEGSSDHGGSGNGDSSGNRGSSSSGGSSGNGQSTDNGGSTGGGGSAGSEDPAGNGDPSTGGQDPQHHGSQASDSHEPQAGGVPRTTIQLGSHLSPKVTTIHLGDNGNEQHRTPTSDHTGADAIAPFIIAPFDPFNNPGRQSITSTLNEASLTSQPVVTAAGQKLTISDPSAVSIMGTVITPGGAGVDIKGTPVSLGPSGDLVVGDPGSSSRHSVLTIAGNTVTANPTSFDIAGTPVTAGGPGVTISGVAVSLGSSGNLVVEGSTGATGASPVVFTSAGLIYTSEAIVGGATPAVAQASSVFTIGSVTFTPNPTVFAIGTSTLSAGGPGVTIASTPISLNPQGSLIVGSTTIPLQSPTPSVLTTFGQTFTLESNSRVVVGGVTLSPGGPGATVSEAPISVGVSGLIIGLTTIPLQAPTPTVLTTDGVTLTLNQQSHIAIDGTTLSIGGQGLTVSGTPISIGSAGLVIGSDTVPLPTPTILTTDGMTLTLDQQSHIAIDGTTLSPGGQGLTVSGTPISIGSNGLVIGSDTVPLQTPTPTILTTDNQVLTLEPSGRVAVGGVTLSAGGPAATVSGASISVDASDIVIGTDTIPLPSGSGNGSSVEGFTSAASRHRGGLLGVLGVVRTWF
ncbi:MAG: hypothetical protein Q9195_008812 [Heterodermia aff. obscurata]